MSPKRKNPFPPSYGSRNSHKNPRFRRRDEIEESPVDLSDPSSLQPWTVEGVQKTVEKKVEQGKKLVFRALKKARGFEKQKLVKRLKIARGVVYNRHREKNEDTVVKKLEFEFEVLKTEQINLNSLAFSHVLKTLSKSKSISSSLLFPPWLVMQKEAGGQLSERGKTKRNLIARLYNSNSVKEEMLVVVRNVQKAMGMHQVETKTGERQIKSEKRQLQVGSEDEVGEGSGGRRGWWVAQNLHGSEVGDSTTQNFVKGFGVEEEWGGIIDLGTSEDSEIDLDAFAVGFEDRLAGPPDGEGLGLLKRDTDDEWSGGQEDDKDYYKDETRNANPEILPEQKSEPKPKSKSKDQQDDTPVIPKSKRSEPPKPSSSKTSTFLPTLMSGYISGSDSDIDANYCENKNGNNNGPVEAKQRKNRMGQQARRALWEKKFGKNADHVKREEADQGRKKIEWRIKQSKGADGEKGDGVEKKGKSTEIEGPLHPSWEAVRKVKEQQSRVQGAAMGKPMGKKIVFD